MVGLIPKTFVVVLGWLIVTDIAGALVVTLFNFLSLEFVAYAIWFVAGAYCGIFAYNSAYEWSSPAGGGEDLSERPDAGRIGTGVLVVGILVVAALTALFYALVWTQGDGSDDDYAPGSMPHSLVFFAAVGGGMAFMRSARPAKVPPRPDGP
jgi:hypothetical protein